MKLIFKIIEYLPETEQIVVKCCRQNAPKPIDDYDAVAIDLMHLDCNGYEFFKRSLFMNLMHNIKNQIEDEPICPENESVDETQYEYLNDYINKIIGIDFDGGILTDLSLNYQEIKKIVL